MSRILFVARSSDDATNYLKKKKSKENFLFI